MSWPSSRSPALTLTLILLHQPETTAVTDYSSSLHLCRAKQRGAKKEDIWIPDRSIRLLSHLCIYVFFLCYFLSHLCIYVVKKNSGEKHGTFCHIYVYMYFSCVTFCHIYVYVLHVVNKNFGEKHRTFCHIYVYMYFSCVTFCRIYVYM